MEGRVSFPSPPIPSSFPDGCERGPKRREGERTFDLSSSYFPNFVLFPKLRTQVLSLFRLRFLPLFGTLPPPPCPLFSPSSLAGKNWGTEKSLLSSSFSLFRRGSFYDVRMSEESTFACFRMRLLLLEKLPSGEKRRHWRRPLITGERLKQGSRLNPAPSPFILVSLQVSPSSCIT